MSRNLSAQDKLNEARYLIEAIFLAAAGLGDKHTSAIQIICEEADNRIDEAQSLLDPTEEVKAAPEDIDQEQVNAGICMSRAMREGNGG